MNRKIEFRGKGIEEYDKDKWYYSYYIKLDKTIYCFKEDYDNNSNNIEHKIVFDVMTDWDLPNQHKMVDIDINTLGQYTGLKDKNGKKIFEGDILQGERYQFIVKWNRHRMGFALYPTTEEIFDEIPVNVENKLCYKVIGNIYEKEGK